MAEAAARSALLDEVRRVVLEELEGLPVRVFLFGSWARGEARPDSDVDVAVRPLAPLPRGVLARLRQRLEESTVPRRVEVVDLAEAPQGLVEAVAREGIEWTG